MGRILELDKDSEEVTVSANVVGEDSDIIVIEVPPTKSFTLFANSLIQQFLTDSGAAELPDDSRIELWVEDVSGDSPVRLREWKYGRFSNADQFNTDEQIRLDIERSVLLPELHKIIFKLNSSVVVDFSQTSTNFLFQIDRAG